MGYTLVSSNKRVSVRENIEKRVSLTLLFCFRVAAARSVLDLRVFELQKSPCFGQFILQVSFILIDGGANLFEWRMHYIYF